MQARKTTPLRLLMDPGAFAPDMLFFHTDGDRSFFVPNVQHATGTAHAGN